MDARRRRRHLERLVGRITAANPATVEGLCAAVAEHLGRPIRLLPVPLPADAPCGLVLTTASTHYVAYDNTTTPLHQRHIIGHELGHLIAGHTSDRILEDDASRLLMPTLDPEVVRSLLARTPGYSLPAEREAETIADLLWRRTKPWAAEPTWKVSASAADVIARIRHSLTGE